MTSLLCFVVGLYLVTDSFYLAPKASGKESRLIIAKYIFAFMSGWYLISVPVAEVMRYFDLEVMKHYKPIPEEAVSIRLMFGCTIALFMWPDTCYRVFAWLRKRKAKLYIALVSRYPLPQRRREP